MNPELVVILQTLRDALEPMSVFLIARTIEDGIRSKKTTVRIRTCIQVRKDLDRLESMGLISKKDGEFPLQFYTLTVPAEDIDKLLLL